MGRERKVGMERIFKMRIKIRGNLLGMLMGMEYKLFIFL